MSKASSLKIDISAIDQYAGTYGQFLLNETINGLDIVKDIPFRFNVTSPQNLTLFKGAKGWRPYTSDVSKPMGKSSFSNRKLTPRVGMKILSINPEDSRTTFISEMLSANAPDIPPLFHKWIWDGEFKTVAQEMNDNTFESEYAGDAPDWDPAAAYTASTTLAPVYMTFTDNHIYKCITTTTAGQSPLTHPAKWTDITSLGVTDGPHTIIKREIAGGGLTNVITTGALTTSNAKTKAELMYSSISTALKKEPTVLRMSFDVFQKYIAEAKSNPQLMLAMGAKYDGSTLNLYLENSAGRCRIQVCSWMGASQRMILTHEQGLIGGTDFLSDTTGLGKLIPTLHGYDCILKAILCFQFPDLSIVYVNDQV